MLFYSSAMRRLFARSSLAIAVSAACAANAAPVLEEVLVTAQKRAQSAQDIPVAVTGLGGDQLDKLGFENATDVSAQVPNMQVSGPYGDVQPIFSIRGVSMSDYSSDTNTDSMPSSPRSARSVGSGGPSAFGSVKSRKPKGSIGRSRSKGKSRR